MLLLIVFTRKNFVVNIVICTQQSKYFQRKSLHLFKHFDEQYRNRRLFSGFTFNDEKNHFLVNLIFWKMKLFVETELRHTTNRGDAKPLFFLDRVTLSLWRFWRPRTIRFSWRARTNSMVASHIQHQERPSAAGALNTYCVCACVCKREKGEEREQY